MANEVIKEVLVCTACGSKDVESKVWYNHLRETTDPLNTNDAQDYYYNTCEEHVLLEIKEE